MTATLTVTHKAIGAEVRRHDYEVLVDGEPVGSVAMNDTFTATVEAGEHTLALRDGKKSSKPEAFTAADGDVVAFRCTGKRALPLFLASFVDPKLALVLVRE